MAEKYLSLMQNGKEYNLYNLPKGFVIKGSVNLTNEGLTELPDLSEVSVKGSFWCGGNYLTSLKGAPKEVGGHFDCSDNQLTSLEGAPQKVGGDFSCESNQLTSLQGAPKEVGGSFFCRHNWELNSLLGLPQMKKKHSVYCSSMAVSKYYLPGGVLLAKELYENQTFQNEAKIDELRQRKHQEDIEKRTKTTEKVQSAFDAWLKQNGKNTPEK